jgi:hypothetical protein
MTSTDQGIPLVDTGAPAAVARAGFLSEMRAAALVMLVALPSTLLVALAGCAAVPAASAAHAQPQAKVQATAERAGTAGACAPAAAAWCEAPTKSGQAHVVFTLGTGGTFPE